MFHRVQPVFYAFDLLWLDGCSNASAGCGLWCPVVRPACSTWIT
jgi:hypothetical protein